MMQEARTHLGLQKVYADLQKSSLRWMKFSLLWAGALVGAGLLPVGPGHTWVRDYFLMMLLIAAAMLIVPAIVRLCFVLLFSWNSLPWAQPREAYIAFDPQAVTVLGANRIPWASLEYMRTEILRYWGSQRQAYTLLVLGFSGAQPLAALSLPDLGELQSENWRLRAEYAAQFPAYQDESSYISICIAAPYRDRPAAYLTLSPGEIAGIAEKYWDAAAQADRVPIAA